MTPETIAPKAPRKRKAAEPQAEAKAAPKARKAPAMAPGKRPRKADIHAAAMKGKLPPIPDFTAATHKRFRPLLATAVELAKAGDIEGLKALAVKPISTSPKAIDRYRNFAVIALEARASKWKATPEAQG